MPVPDRPTDGDKDVALARIQHRHRGDDNAYTHLLLSEDPADVLRYLRKRGVRALVGDGDGEHHDVNDALTLRLWLWWRGEADELWLLDAAETLRLSRRRLAAQLGIRTGQGVVDRREATRRRLDPGRADTAPPDPDRTGREQRWLEANRRRLRATAEALLRYWDLAGDDEDVADWMAEVRSDLHAGACTRAAFVVLDQAAEAMSAVPAVRELPADHPLTRELAAWRRLVTQRPG